MPSERDDLVSVSRWPVWSLPRSVRSLIVTVELLALGSVVAGFAVGIPPVSTGWPLTLLALVLAGILGTEASLGVERARRQSDETPHIDLSSVWLFAAAALLPSALAAVTVMISFGYLYLRVWRSVQVPLHRVLFSAATVLLAVRAVELVLGLAGTRPFHSVPGLLVVALAMLAYATLNMGLIVAVIVLSGPNPGLATCRQVLRRGDDAVLEFATLSLGAVAAGAMDGFGPLYAVLVLPPLIILHRTVLVRQLEEEATTDSKTGLLNSAAWDIEADRAIRRIGRLDGGNATVLLLDLDNFKQVNDEHGHLVGDQVLVAVATAIREVVRDDDLVGRFGGEEFVVLLPAPDGDPERAGAWAAANRIRRRVEQLSITVSSPFGQFTVGELSISIGGATSPGDGTALPDLVKVADAAMYAAKRAGRNRVCMGRRGIDVPADGGQPASAVDHRPWVVGRSRSSNDSPAPEV